LRWDPAALTVALFVRCRSEEEQSDGNLTMSHTASDCQLKTFDLPPCASFGSCMIEHYASDQTGCDCAPPYSAPAAGRRVIESYVTRRDQHAPTKAMFG